MQKLSRHQIEDVLDIANTMQLKDEYLREGQAFFNALYVLHPDIANAIRGTDKDPFYNDNKMQECIDFVLTPAITPESSAG